MLIATAGHIDHGKTALVRALTGTDTDRLPEEKGRGISIDLGFAYWRTAGGDLLGFVDVPGHERFVGNMLAGLCGVDFALLVVAADDGVMPQTIEHLAMLGLMGIKRGFVVLTKCDRVDAARRQAVSDAVAGLLGGGALAGAPLFAVSSLTGEGIAELAAALAAKAPGPAPATTRAPRFAIDRSFSVTGAGTVVTGTLLAGTILPDDQLILSPPGAAVRVRGLQCAGAPADRIAAGMRAAINLGGIAARQISRGDWLLDPALHAPSMRVDARISVLANHGRALRHGAALRLHLGAAEVPARVLARRQAAIAPGTDALVTLALERPCVAINGARFVVRDGSGRALVGGGRIVDPFAPPRMRRHDARERLIAALELHEPGASLAALLADGRAIDCRWFERSFGLGEKDAGAIYQQCDAQVLGKTAPMALSRARLATLDAAILGLLAQCHADRPEVGGLSARDIGRAIDPALPAEALGAVLRQMANRAAIEFAGPVVRLAGHRPSFSDAEKALWRALGEWLEGGPPRTVTPAELAQMMPESESTLRAMLLRRRIAGDLWAIAEGRFMLPDHVARLAASAAWLASQFPEGFTAAQFRDATGIGRNHVIRLLEFFDRLGVCLRRGEYRVMRGGWQAIVGEAGPWLAGQAAAR